MKIPFTIVFLLVFKLCAYTQIIQRDLKETPSYFIQASKIDISIRFCCACGATLKNISPLYIVNGTGMPLDSLKNIEPQSISSITVLKGKEATRTYGRKAKNGVVIITLKEIMD